MESLTGTHSETKIVVVSSQAQSIGRRCCNSLNKGMPHRKVEQLILCTCTKFSSMDDGTPMKLAYNKCGIGTDRIARGNVIRWSKTCCCCSEHVRNLGSHRIYPEQTSTVFPNETLLNKMLLFLEMPFRLRQISNMIFCQIWNFHYLKICGPIFRRCLGFVVALSTNVCVILDQINPYSPCTW